MNSRSLIYYQGIGYGDINKLLRHDNVTDEFISKNIDHDLIQHIVNIDKSIDESEIEEELVLYRGYTTVDLHKHTNIIEKAFSSCSRNLDIASNSFSSAEIKCCILVFTLPPEIKAYKYKYRGEMTENEYLLRRNVEFFNIKLLGLTNKNVEVFQCNIRPYIPPTEEETIKYHQELDKMRQQMLKEDYDFDGTFSDSETE